MHIHLIYLFLSFFLTTALYPIWINFVYKYQMGEKIRDDGPKSHLEKVGTPTMGGLVFILSVSLITFVFNKSRTQTIFPLFIASIAGLFGLIEDLSKIYKNKGVIGRVFPKLSKITNKVLGLFKEFWRIVGSSTDVGLETYQKFMIQGVIGGFVAFWTYFKLGWDYIWFPLIGNIHIGWLYPVVIFLFFIVILNSVAFTDGVDGLAGGLGLIAFLAFWVISAQLEYNSLAGFSAAFVGALLPFLYFNIHPARIFMGNVGSHVLGSTLAVLAVVTHREIAMIVVLAVFLLDGISSPLQQISYKLTQKRIFRMAPIHHHFELLGWSENKVSIRFWLAGVFFAFFGIVIALL